jgi:hypothetical protein
MSEDPMQARVDQIVDDDIRQGVRYLPVPADMVAILKSDHEVDPTVPVLTHIRFTKLTARKRRLINEAVVARYHADLQNPQLLSSEQIRKLNVERGEWSAEQEKQIKDLQGETSALSAQFYVDNFDDQRVADELQSIAERFQTFMDQVNGEAPIDGMANDFHLSDTDKQELYDRFVRWVAWTPDTQTLYTLKYAALQGRDEYNPDDDEQYLIRTSPGMEGAQLIVEAGELRDRLIGMRKLLDKRRTLLELELKRSQIFRESVENRRDQADEYARLYYVTEACDADGKVLGPLTKKLDDLWNLPEEFLQWMLIEAYLFLNGVPDGARAYLTKMGFLRAPRQAGGSQSSGDLPAEPSSKIDSPASTETPPDSTV